MLLGRGDGTFRRATHYGVDGGPVAVAIADLNGDGRPDLVIANLGSDDVSALLGQGMADSSAPAATTPTATPFRLRSAISGTTDTWTS